MSSSSTVTMARDKVLGDDDLLTEILSRMPPKHIYKSRFVSKRWNNLISSTYFLQNHKAKRQEQFPPPLICMLTSPKVDLLMTDLLMPEEELSSSTPGQPWKLPGYKSNFFRSSSNGLILVEDQDVAFLLRVVNLQTDVSVQLPTPPRRAAALKYKTVVALVYDEVEAQQLMRPSYKVIIAPAEIDDQVDVLPILIYSPHTGFWTESSIRSPKGITFTLKRFKPPISVNGFLHWYCDPWGIAIMDTKQLFNRAKIIDIQLIPLPNISSRALEPYFNFAFTRSSCDDLWFAAIDECDNIKFWKLPKEKHSNYSIIEVEEWILMDSDSLPQRLKCPDCVDSSFGVVYKIEALIPWNGDINVFLRRRCECYTIFGYPRQSKSLDFKLFYEYDPDDEDPSLGWLGLSPIMEPLTLSSYGTLNIKSPSVWRCRKCDINCNECYELVHDKRVQFSCFCFTLLKDFLLFIVVLGCVLLLLHH